MVCYYSSLAGEIQQIMHSDWFLKQAEFSHPNRFVNELEAIVNLFPFFYYHRQLINASLSLFTFRWQRKSS